MSVKKLIDYWLQVLWTNLLPIIKLRIINNCYYYCKLYFVFEIGTLEAASKIIKKSGAKIEIGFVLMEKCELEGRKRLDFPVISLISE